MSRGSNRIKAQYTEPLGVSPTRIVVVEDSQEFAALEEEWGTSTVTRRELPRSSPGRSSTLGREYHGESYESQLVAVGNDGRLVDLVSLMLESQRGFGRLLFFGQRYHVPPRRAREGRVGAAGRISVWRSNCPMIDVKPWDELLTSLSENLPSAFRRALCRAEEDGVRCELAGVEGAEGAARRLIALHREASQGQEIGPEHLTQRFEAHPGATGRRITARGLGAVSEYWRDGVVISHFLVFGRDFVGAYLQGANQEALRRYKFSSLCIWDAMNIAVGGNSRRLDLLRGRSPTSRRGVSG
jgi:hypothetical protein